MQARRAVRRLKRRSYGQTHAVVAGAERRSALECVGLQQVLDEDIRRVRRAVGASRLRTRHTTQVLLQCPRVASLRVVRCRRYSGRTRCTSALGSQNASAEYSGLRRIHAHARSCVWYGGGRHRSCLLGVGERRTLCALSRRHAVHGEAWQEVVPPNGRLSAVRGICASRNRTHHNVRRTARKSQRHRGGTLSALRTAAWFRARRRRSPWRLPCRCSVQPGTSRIAESAYGQSIRPARTSALIDPSWVAAAAVAPPAA